MCNSTRLLQTNHANFCSLCTPIWLFMTENLTYSTCTLHFTPVRSGVLLIATPSASTRHIHILFSARKNECEYSQLGSLDCMTNQEVPLLGKKPPIIAVLKLLANYHLPLVYHCSEFRFATFHRQMTILFSTQEKLVWTLNSITQYVIRWRGN